MSWRNSLTRLPPTRRSPKEESAAEIARLEAKAEQIKLDLQEQAEASRHTGLPAPPAKSGELIRFSCEAHRWGMSPVPGAPPPHRSLCPTCISEARAKQRSDDTPRVMVDLAPSGLRPARNERPWTTREWELYEAHQKTQREAGQVLPGSAEEHSALDVMDQARWRDEREEQLRALSPAERIQRVRRQRSGRGGGTLNVYEPSPVRRTF